MAFTSSDRDSVEAALTALACGQRVVRVRFDDGQEVQYSEADISKLQNLLGQIKSDISRTAGKKRYRRVITSKGY